MDFFRLNGTNAKKQNPLVPLPLLDATSCLDMQNVTGVLISPVYYIAGERAVHLCNDGDAGIGSVGVFRGKTGTACKPEIGVVSYTLA